MPSFPVGIAAAMRFSFRPYRHSYAFSPLAYDSLGNPWWAIKRIRRQNNKGRSRRRGGKEAEELTHSGVEASVALSHLETLIEYFLHLMSLSPQWSSHPSAALSPRLQITGRLRGLWAKLQCAKRDRTNRRYTYVLLGQKGKSVK